jgi:predicted ATPase
LDRLRLLAGLHIFLIRVADVRRSFVVAEELASTARNAGDATGGAVADWMLGCSHHFAGNQAAALEHLKRGFMSAGDLPVRVFGLDYRARALVTLNGVLWLSGLADRAMESTRALIREAEASSRPLDLCFSYLYTAPLFLWWDDLGSARDVLEKLITHPNWQALPSLHATATALQGELLIRRGEAARGVTVLRAALNTMQSHRQNLLVRRASCALAEGLAATGHHDEALIVIGGALAEREDVIEASQIPELLRVQACILMSMPQADESRVEAVLMQALAEARRQGALAWELRAAMTLARLRARQGRGAEGREVLALVHARFAEGFDTSDLEAARDLLRTLA